MGVKIDHFSNFYTLTNLYICHNWTGHGNQKRDNVLS